MQQSHRMANHKALFSFSFLAVFILATSSLSKASDEDRKVYIVYMGALPGGAYEPSSHHLRILQNVNKKSDAAKSLIVSYKRCFNGFAANITEEERQKISSLKEVVSVFPSDVLHTQTTRSWDFMGFPETSARSKTTESDIIIGVIDTGIWPESESFSDEGFSPPPKKWKGVCKGGLNFTCNNKIIGARVYGLGGNLSARDSEGHGTHTASIAAGNAIKGASFFGIGEGTARGGVPSARIAVYKVCNPFCKAHNIMAAIDDAVADGVDIITMSLGHDRVEPYDTDIISIGAFHAMTRGILSVHSAGNSGPDVGTTPSVAPWLLTVAASNMDRRIGDKLVLGNGVEMIGNSVNSFSLNGTTFPLIVGANASKQCSDFLARICNSNCLDPGLVKGKIVVCFKRDVVDEVFRAGAVGSIVSGRDDNIAFNYPIPVSALNSSDFATLTAYLNSSDNPKANILKSESIKDPTAPTVAPFSSRGPNPVTKDIMKPDISAPGVNILAAFPPNCSPTESYLDKRRAKYIIQSGTSMSCPHVTGAAAYVKSFHRDWSSSAIKSALMTTAGKMKEDSYSLRELDYGSGHVDPIRAVNPGLVYDADKEDYVKFLCSIGYTDERVRLISGDKTSCVSQGSEEASARDLNYPSMTALVTLTEPFTVRFRRKVRNVGPANSTYKAVVSQTPRMSIKVEPSVLSFESVGEEKSFDVTVNGSFITVIHSVVSASLVWSDGTHSVRSPIVLHSYYNV